MRSMAHAITFVLRTIDERNPLLISSFVLYGVTGIVEREQGVCPPFIFYQVTRSRDLEFLPLRRNGHCFSIIGACN
jgi:hypothetical protein